MFFHLLHPLFPSDPFVVQPTPPTKQLLTLFFPSEHDVCQLVDLFLLFSWAGISSVLWKVQSYEAAESPWMFCEVVAEFRWMDFSEKGRHV